MYLAYSAKLLSSYPSGVVPLPELSGWTAIKPVGRDIYTVNHNLNADPSNISITGIALDPGITVNYANIESNSFEIMAQKDGEECTANFMFVLVLKN